VVLGRPAPEFLPRATSSSTSTRRARARSTGRRARVSRERVAQGIVDVANNNMAQALRLVSTDRGYDPRGSTLVAYGGAGPLHACELARALQIGQVLVPRYPGAFSAFGALLADTRFDYTRTHWMRMRGLDIETANALLAGLERQAAEDFRREGFAEAPKLLRSIDMRYVGQNWELTVSMPGGELATGDFERAASLFEAEHERFYGYSIPGEELELLTFNVAAVGSRHTVELPRIEPGPAPAPIDRRGVVFRADDGPVETAIHRREAFPGGIEIDGPAIVGQVDATTLVPPGATARVDEYANLLITVGEGK
jgi:N-methylhydantoinase A